MEHPTVPGSLLCHINIVNEVLVEANSSMLKKMLTKMESCSAVQCTAFNPYLLLYSSYEGNDAYHDDTTICYLIKVIIIFHVV